MSIDWSATGAWMQAWAGFAQAFAIVAAAILATNTFRSWRQQKLEERKIDAAEKILTLAYRLRDAFSAIRSPLRSAAATDEATFNLINSGIDLESIPSDRRLKIVESQVVLDRINSNSELWRDFTATLPLGTALLGNDVDKILRELWRQKTAVQVAAQHYPDDDGNDQQFSNDISITIWERRQKDASEEDKISKTVNLCISELEDVLIPIIRSD
jgi:hypothetical protein